MKIVRTPMGIGNTYEGEWSNGAANGHGVLTYSNGDRYEGQWRNDQENGFGVLSFVDGRRYEGNWLNGKKSGHGVFTFPNGKKYEGEYFNDLRNGYGVETFADGERYEGNWINGKKNGQGVYFYKSGGNYNGNWVDNMWQGHGVYTFANGDIIDCQWINGVRNGAGSEIFPDGSRYDGMYNNGKRHGDGVYTFESGRRLKKLYDNGTLISEEELPPVEKSTISSTDIPSWNSVKSGEFKKKQVSKTTRKNKISSVVNMLRNPTSFSDPDDRNIEESCRYLGQYIDEATDLFLARKEVEAAEIIGEILGVTFDPNEDWFGNDEIKYFSDFLCAALYSIGKKINFDTPDHDRIIIPAANIACYMWEDYGDTKLFSAVTFIWVEAGKDCEADYLWFVRMRENGDYRIRDKYSEIDEKYYGLDVDSSIMGSDCKLYSPGNY